MHDTDLINQVIRPLHCKVRQPTKGPICVSYTVFHDPVGRSSERIHNQKKRDDGISSGRGGRKEGYCKVKNFCMVFNFVLLYFQFFFLPVYILQGWPDS